MDLISEKSNEYLIIIEKNEDAITTMKLLRNLIINKNCTQNIKIDYRKRVFDYFCKRNEKVTSDNINLIETAITECSAENKKLDINFIKLGLKFYEDKTDYANALKWVNYYDCSILNKDRFGKNRYSDYDLFYLKKSKYLQFLNKKEVLLELEKQYINSGTCDKEVVFFIKYHICKLYFFNRDYEKANKILEELLLIKRDPYLLTLPIKYKDIKNVLSIYFLIIELLIVHGKYLDLYIYDSILNFIKELDGDLYTKLLDFIEIKEGKISSCKKNKFNSILYSYIMEKNEILPKIYKGYIFNISKSGNGFIKSDSFPENVFVRKELIIAKKRNDYVKFFVIDSKDKNGLVKPNAILVEEVFYE